MKTDRNHNELPSRKKRQEVAWKLFRMLIIRTAHSILLRPLIDSLLPSFQALPQDQMYVEHLPFKGISSLEQYIPKNTYKWEYKSLCALQHKRPGSFMRHICRGNLSCTRRARHWGKCKLCSKPCTGYAWCCQSPAVLWQLVLLLGFVCCSCKQGYSSSWTCAKKSPAGALSDGHREEEHLFLTMWK